MVKFELEYEVHTTVKVLYPRLATPSGLSDWFADNVDLNDDVYTFFWEGSEQSAKLLSKKRDKSIRFRWMEDEEAGEDVYFEFRIRVDELTNEVALIITDFADDDDLDGAKELWDKQIERFRRNLGM